MATQTQQPLFIPSSIPDESYDAIFHPIVNEKSAIGSIGTLIGFLRRKSDLFEDENVESKIIEVVSSVREGVGNWKKKVEERELEDLNMRLDDVVTGKKDEFETPGGERGTAIDVKCDICGEAHVRWKCRYLCLAPEPVSVNNRPSPKISCFYCNEEHKSSECEQYFEIMNKKWVSSDVDDDDDLSSMSSITESEREADEEYLANRPKECPICCREHDYSKGCSYSDFIPPYATVGPRYVIRCDICDRKIGNNMACCPFCGSVESGYLVRKICDDACQGTPYCSCAAFHAKGLVYK